MLIVMIKADCSLLEPQTVLWDPIDCNLKKVKKTQYKPMI